MNKIPQCISIKSLEEVSKQHLNFFLMFLYAIQNRGDRGNRSFFHLPSLTSQSGIYPNLVIIKEQLFRNISVRRVDGISWFRSYMDGIPLSFNVYF